MSESHGLYPDREVDLEKLKRGALRFHNIGIQNVRKFTISYLTTVPKDREARREKGGNSGWWSGG